MKILSHKDYRYVRPDLLVRLWKYKNRNGIVYDKVEVGIFGIVHILTQTPYGILNRISLKFSEAHHPNHNQ